MNTNIQPAPANTAAVQQWRDAGFQPFPCCPARKKPLFKGWRALAGPHQLAELWKQNNHAMPGLDCGSAGLVVVDCDVRPGKDGEAAFRTLCEQLVDRI
jgi:hypothetical protein